MNRRNHSQPLSGVRVLDFTVAWAGPYACMLLADLGADVIKVENVNFFQTITRGMQPKPGKDYILSQVAQIGGYPDREPGERPWNRTPFFNAHARNKKSVTIDITQEFGRELLWKLVEISDVVVENNPTETMEKRDVTWERLSALNPRIIYVRLPAFGNSGPYVHHRAFGSHLEAIIGHTALRCYPDMDPSMNNTTFPSDFLGGISGAESVLLALLQRETTGRGCLVEVPQAENALGMLADAIMDWTVNGRERGPIGNRDEVAVQNCYPCRSEGIDRWINIRIESDADWESLKRGLGQPQWATGGRFATVHGRRRHQDEIDRHLSEWTRVRDSHEAMFALQEAGVIAGPVIDHAMAFEDPQLRERGFFQELHQEDTGTYLYPGASWKSLRHPVAFHRGPVRLGEDNQYVYKELLGVSDDEYERLEREGFLGMDYAAKVLGETGVPQAAQAADQKSKERADA